ncbi:MAG: DUF6148 family protein [Clostridiaceae bacterium]
MAEISRLDRLKLRLDMYYKAEEAILNGAQSYQMGTKQLTRANLSHIKEMIEQLEREVAIEQSKTKRKGRNRVIGVIPRDF